MPILAAPHHHMPDCHDTDHRAEDPCETVPETVAGITTTRIGNGTVYLTAEDGFRTAANIAALITHLQGVHAAIGGAR